MFFFYNGIYENGHPNKKHPLYNFSCTILHIKKTEMEWDANDVFDGRFTNNSVIPSKMYVKIIYAWDMKNVKLWRNEAMNTEYVYCSNVEHVCKKAYQGFSTKENWIIKNRDFFWCFL